MKKAYVLFSIVLMGIIGFSDIKANCISVDKLEMIAAALVKDSPKAFKFKLNLCKAVIKLGENVPVAIAQITEQLNVYKAEPKNVREQIVNRLKESVQILLNCYPQELEKALLQVEAWAVNFLL